MFKYLILFCLCVVFFSVSCKSRSQGQSSQALPAVAAIKSDELIGTWYSNEWDLYHTIYVQDSTHLVIENHIDTLFFYDYALRRDTLFIYKKYGQLVSYHPILRLTKDSLIFDGFLDKPAIQRYSRTKKE